jgi:hypothetical protein
MLIVTGIHCLAAAMLSFALSLIVAGRLVVAVVPSPI